MTEQQSDQTQPDQPPGKPGPKKADSTDSVVGWWVAGAFVAWLVLAFGGSYLRETLLGLEELDIVAAIRVSDPAPGGASRASCTAAGVIVSGGEPAPGARVWAVASDDQGNRVAITGEQTNAGGNFELGPFDAAIGAKPVTLVVVHASWRKPGQTGSDGKAGTPGSMRSGRETLRLGAIEGPVVRTRRLAPPFQVALMFALALAGFLLSIVVAVIPENFGLGQRPKYFIALAFALLLMVMMSLAILNGMTYVATRGVTGDVFTFGFASVFFGSHASDVPGEWMLSLTTPSADLSRGAIGFYAPLWVMLMSVIGAGLLTVSLLVAEIKEPPAFSDENAPDVRRRIQNIVMHQFFMMFAPLGAVFVYQMLLAGKAAEEPAVVAIAAMGAGATINALLKVAVDRGVELFSAKGTPGEGKPAKE